MNDNMAYDVVDIEDTIANIIYPGACRSWSRNAAGLLPTDDARIFRIVSRDDAVTTSSPLLPLPRRILMPHKAIDMLMERARTERWSNYLIVRQWHTTPMGVALIRLANGEDMRTAPELAAPFKTDGVLGVVLPGKKLFMFFTPPPAALD